MSTLYSVSCPAPFRAGGGVGSDALPGASSGTLVRRPGPRAARLLRSHPAALAARLPAAGAGLDLADPADDLQLPSVRAAALQGGAQDSRASAARRCGNGNHSVNGCCRRRRRGPPGNSGERQGLVLE